MAFYIPRLVFSIAFVVCCSFSSSCLSLSITQNHTAASESAPAPAPAAHLHNLGIEYPSLPAVTVFATAFIISACLSCYVLEISRSHQEAVSLWIANLIRDRPLIAALYSGVAIQVVMIFEDQCGLLVVFGMSFLINAISSYFTVIATAEDAARVSHVLFAKQLIELSLLLSKKGWWVWWIYIAEGLSIITLLGLISTRVPITVEMSNAVKESVKNVAKSSTVTEGSSHGDEGEGEVEGSI